MHRHPVALLALSWAGLASAAKFLHSVPEDPFAFPKYRVSFLNGLPVLNETAERWLQHGLKGGEHEFLDQPWDEPLRDQPPTRKEIGNGDDENISDESQVAIPNSSPFRLEHMKIGPKLSYVCLIPPPPEPSAHSPSEEELQAEAQVDPLYSWSLLQPLEGHCLYHRQAWFTYSYCHGSRVRQFHEAPHTHPHPPGGYVPEEDPESDAYTLGEAPPAPEPGAELTPAQQHALNANLELAHGAGQRYLVQRWGGGTVCDKTGRRREIEVQFHCSPTSTDTILFVKEIRTCAYVLVVHTPRLCGVPGFRARRDAQAHEQIRCREVVHALQSHAGVGLPSADSPIRLPQRPKPSLPAPAKEQPPPVPGEKKAVPGAGMTDEMVKKALSLLLGADGENVGIERVTVQPGAEEGEYIVELLDEDYAGGDGYGYPQGADNAATREALLKILQGAGVDVAGYAAPPDGKGKEKNKKQQQQQQQQQKFSHDEMEEEDEEDMPIFRDEL